MSCGKLKNYVVYHLVPTSNHNANVLVYFSDYVVYHLVPTSNHNRIQQRKGNRVVVYHLVPTSNHNCVNLASTEMRVVYHLVPTSNHNTLFVCLFTCALFIILFLHQTTTDLRFVKSSQSCLSSCSYIKPQPSHRHGTRKMVVYHLVPTSNHNLLLVVFAFLSLFIILFLHQTTTNKR